MTAAMENSVVLVVEPLTSLVEDQIKEASYPGRFVGGAGYGAKIKRATAMNLRPTSTCTCTCSKLQKLKYFSKP